MSKDILAKVNNYYTQKVQEHGTSPRGVDWNSEESQVMRFDQISKVIDYSQPCRVLDYGCGYGAMLDYFMQRTNNVHFTGLDISEEMIAAAKKTHAGKNADWKTQLESGDTFDYIVASGIFNVRLETPEADWEKYVLDTMHTMDKHSTKGFSFNVLTSYSDKEYMKDYLYYANPGMLFDYCKRNFSKYVAILHDYPLYEFTILVRKY
jgi:cyclopropane fatty-acyl-phospholipid synthase-like methyltransferase